jgi:C1A family cysteine protease
MPDSPAPDPASLIRENAALQAKLDDYKALEEDLMAKRVFDKARRYLTTWITFGGIILTLTGFVGYQSVISYFRKLAKEKIEALTEEEIHTIVMTTVDIRVEAGVNRAMPEISERISKRVTQVTQPVTGVPTAASGATVSSGVGNAAALAKTSADWTADMSAVRNQGSEGSVVGLSLAATLEFYIYKSTGSHIAISGRDIYNEVRQKAGTLEEDNGAVIRNGIDFLRDVGAVEEFVWPYRPGEYSQPPPPAVATAKRYKITDVRSVVTLEELKAALNYGPVISGINVYESFTTPASNRSGIIPMPKAKEQTIGGFAVCFVGYDDKTKLLKFQNTWGASWGDHGYGYLAYDYFREQSSDGWTFRYAGGH